MLTIHLGAHKTASTHLQLSLRMVRQQLRQGGVFFADPSVLRGPGLPLQHHLRRRNDADADRIAAVLAAAREICPELLLSDENILGGTHRSRFFGPKGMIYPGAAERLRRVLGLAGGGPAVLCMAVRDPASFNVSAFALQLALGNERDIGTFLGGRDPARLNWSGLARRLTGIAGVARLLVWRYEDYAALRPRLLARLLPPHLARLVPDPPPSNESLSQAGYEWFLREAARGDADLRLLVRRAREAFPRHEGHAPLRPLAEADYLRAAQRYEADLAQLCDLPAVEFLRP